jgi:hypothetical protein
MKLWSLWDIMQQFDTKFWTWAAALLGTLEAEGRFAARNPDHLKTSEADALNAGDELWMPQWANNCDELGMTATAATLRKIITVRAGGAAHPSTMAELIPELRLRLLDEMSAVPLYWLNPAQRNLLINPLAGWEEVIKRFANTVGDIEESSRCFALERYAAAVWHSTQITEIGLIAVGEFLRVKDPLSGYTATKNELDRILRTKYPERTEREKKHTPFLEQLQGTIVPLANAWRNKISHAQGRLVLMTSEFQPYVAEDIMNATRSFMRRLAFDLPEGDAL